MRIRTKLYLGFGIIMVFAIITLSISLLGINSIRNELRELTTTQYQLDRLGNDIRYYDSLLTDDVRAYLIDPSDETTYTNYFEHAAILDETLAEARSLATSEEALQILANIDAANIALIAFEEQLLANPDIETAVALYRGEYGDLKAIYSANVEQFFILQRSELDAKLDATFAIMNRTTTLTIGSLSLSIIIGMALALLVSQNISVPLVALANYTQQVAAGNLDQQIQVTSNDEIGRLANTFNQMSSQLKASFDILETQLSERSNYLSTTVEVGTLATRFNNQEEMLPAITNFIRSRFNLYYTQIYILDETGRYAILRAGTGDVGEQLLARKHRLDTEGTSLVATAVQSQQPVLVSNTEISDIHLTNELLPDTRSEVSIPLIVGTEVMGVLDLQAVDVDTFNEVNLGVFEAMASQIAVALYSTRAYAQVQTAIERAEKLNQRITAENWRGYLGSLGTGNKVQYQFDAYGRDDLRLLDDNTSLHDIAQAIQHTHSLNQSVQLGGQMIGHIVIGEDNEREWTQAERALIEDAAEQLAQAAEQFRAFDATESAQRISTQLYQIGQQLALTDDFGGLVKVLGESSVMKGAMSISLFAIELDIGSTPEWLELLALYGESPTKVGDRFYLPEFPFSKVWLSSKREATAIGNVHEDERVDNNTRDLLRQFGTPALLVLPLVSGQNWSGLLTVSWATTQSFTPEQNVMYQSLISPIATTMNNILLLDQTKRRAVEMETVAIVSATATSILDMGLMLESVVELTKNQFDLYHTHIYLLDEAKGALRLTAGAGEVGQQMVANGHQINSSNRASLVARAARTREGVVVDDVTQAPDFLPNPFLPDTRSEMSVPMIVGEKVIGVLDAQSSELARFNENDIQVFTALASQIAVAIENARAFEREHETVQRLREVDQLKSQFLANMSHELRTPLNSIIGYAGILIEGADGELPEEAVEDIDIIHESGKHLLAIINDILDLAKIEAREMKLRFIPTDLPKLLDEVIRSGQVLASNKNITLELVEENPVPQVNVDLVRMRQVTWNLVSNAMKFTDKGGVTVRYGMLNDQEVFVRIEDTGMGIPEDHLAQVFERFRQVDESSTRSAGGTGLGLTITRELIQLHGGEVYAESEVGVGSTFWFKLPIAELESELTK